MIRRPHPGCLLGGLLATVLTGCTKHSIRADDAAARPSSVTATAASLPVPTRAADGSFPEALRWQDAELRRNGVGLCEWGLLGIDLYVAALYSERRITDLPSALSPDQRTIVHLHFVRGLSAEQLRQAFSASVSANAGAAADVHAPALQQLLAAMRDVQAGDSFTFGGQPGRGLQIAHNGRAAATIDDEAFRALFLQLYLGDKPPTAGLRRALLGGA